MLYLEDFLELIETLPSEVREKCTTVRELDLSVQNQVELLQKKMQQCSSAGGVNKDDDVRHRQKVLEEVEEGYRGAMVDASEKVNVVGQLFNLVDRYSKRLDEDLNKFKMELEADNAGITQILEAKVSRQLAEEESVSRYSLLGATPAVPEANSSDTASVKSQKSTSSTGHHKSNKNNALKGGGDTRNGTSNSVSQSISNSTAGGSRKSLGSANSADRSGYRNNGSVGGPRVLHASGSSTPLAVKRDPGILDDDEDDDDDDEGFDDPGDKWVQSQRKSSTFGFYTPPTSPPPDTKFHDSLHSSEDRYSLPKSLDLLEKVTGNIAKNYASSSYDTSSVKNRPKRQMSVERLRATSGAGSKPAYVPSGIDSSQYVLSPIVGSTKQRKRKLESATSALVGNQDNDSSTGEDNNEENSAADCSEQRWCICNEYSYGNMIACDNLDCPIEWFHYPCVGIPESGISKKKWYCPKCRAKEKMKKKSSNSKKG